MASRIEWTDETWNPVVGCSHLSRGCEHCFAARMASRGLSPAHRGLTRNGRWTGKVRLLPERLEQPLRWRKPRRIFVCSMSDLFHESVPFEFIAAVFGVMAAAPQHTFQILTKRPAQMAEWFDWIASPSQTWPALKCAMALLASEAKHHPDGDGGPIHCRSELGLRTPWPLPNVWLGVTCEGQVSADKRTPLLLQCPASVRFVSYEPALGSLNLHAISYGPSNRGYVDAFTGKTEFAEVAKRSHAAPPLAALDWVIAGGESGPGARPAHPDWFRSVRDQCAAEGVPFLLKGWGAWAPCPGGPVEDDGPAVYNGDDASEDLRIDRCRSCGVYAAQGDDIDHEMIRLGKRAAGRELDGKIHDEYPE